MTRLSIVALSVAVFAGAAACGGSAKTAGGTKQGATTQLTSAGPASTSQPASAPAVVSVTSTEGFVYKVQALPPFTAPTLTVGSTTQNAPPGKDFIVFNVTVTDGLTDRPEPLSQLGDILENRSNLQIALPIGDLAKYGLSTQNCSPASVAPYPTGWCPLTTTLVSATPEGSLTDPQIQPGQPEKLVIGLGQYQVPQTIALATVALFAELPGQQPVRIPWQS